MQLWQLGGRLGMIVGIAIACDSSFAIAQVKEEPKPVHEASVWMKKKLEYSRNILEGLATGDFDKITSNAESMKGLSKVEGFIRGRTPGYRAQLGIFQEATDEILRQSQAENMEGAALAFTQVTTSCVNCHKQLREGKTAPPAKLPAQKQ